MTCITCANTVEKALRRIPQVKFAAVSLSTSTGFIIAERDIDFEEIRKTVEAVGYGVSRENPVEIEKKRYEEAKKNLLVTWVATTPLMLMMLYHMFMGHIPYFSLIEIVLSTIVIFYTGRHTLRGAYIAVTHFHANMDTLISFGALTSWLTSIFEFLGLPIMSFGSIGAMMMTFHITGRFVESYLRDKVSKEVKALLKLQAKEGRVLTEVGEVMMPVEAIKEGFIVVVKPGERIPVDGEILEGESSIDESIITGESIPVFKKKGDHVVGGSLNISSPLKIKVTKTGNDTFLAKMIELIQQVQGFKVPIQALADRLTGWFVPAILIIALFGSIFWYFNYNRFVWFFEKARSILPWIIHTQDPVSFSVFVFVATIVIACPCALGLAVPMALVAGLGLAAKRGLLIRNAEVIQTSGKIGTILCDKTGTLTEGSPRVVLHTLSEDLLIIVTSMAKKSTHPLSKAIALLSDGELEFEKIEQIAGEGIIATYKGHTYFLGRPLDYSKYGPILEDGKTVVEVREDEKVLGYIVIEDTLRDDSAQAVERLKRMGIDLVIVSGDSLRTTLAIAKKLGIEKVHAEVRPEEKVNLVRYYQSFGRKVAMVGDGVNDAPALKAADIGIAMGSGADITIDNADIIITKGGISKVVDVLEISEKTLSVIKQNLFWAFVYNLVAVPLAVMGLMHPLVAETAMTISSITVILNSVRVRVSNQKLEV